MRIRRARVTLGTGGKQGIEALLPDNYSVVEEHSEYVMIEGKDSLGWTMEDYVLPRLASGLYFAEEVQDRIVVGYCADHGYRPTDEGLDRCGFYVTNAQCGEPLTPVVMVPKE